MAEEVAEVEEVTEVEGVEELAELVAQDLTQYARHQGLTPMELVKTAVLVERLITRTFPGPQSLARAAVFEAHALFDAMTRPIEANEQN